MHRRDVLRAAGVGLSAGLAGCVGGFGSDGSTGRTVRTLEVESSVSAAVFRWGLEQGAWTDRDVDLEFDTAPYNRYNRQIVEDETDVGAPSTVAQLELMERGESLTFVGPQQNMFNRMFARADDATIEDPTDLDDKTLGLPAALTSTTSTVHRVLVEDEYGFDLVEDTGETRTADPPALWEFLHDGEVDAISEFSGHTIKGIAADSVKTIFDPYEAWAERTGVGVPTTTFTVRPDWLSDNAGLVDDFLAGWEAALESFAANAAEALDEFGTEAGITDEAEAEVVEQLMDEGVAFGPAYYEDDLVDAHWQFFELLAAADVVDLGERDAVFTTAEELRD